MFEHHIIAEQSIDGICKEVRQPHKCPRTVVFQKLLNGVHVIVGRFAGFVERVVDDKAEIVVAFSMPLVELTGMHPSLPSQLLLPSRPTMGMPCPLAPKS